MWEDTLLPPLSPEASLLQRSEHGSEFVGGRIVAMNTPNMTKTLSKLESSEIKSKTFGCGDSIICQFFIFFLQSGFETDFKHYKTKIYWADLKKPCLMALVLNPEDIKTMER